MPTLLKAPAQIIIDPAGLNIIISRDQQLGDLAVNPMLDTSPLNSQASSQPMDYIQTGVSLAVDVSIADMDLKLQLFSIAYNTSVVVDGVTPTKKKVLISDLAGAKPQGRKVIIKPYAGLLVDTDANTWITMPNAKIVSLEGTNINYGLTTQQSMVFRFVSCPDVNGVKAILGDETAI